MSDFTGHQPDPVGHQITDLRAKLLSQQQELGDKATRIADIETALAAAERERDEQAKAANHWFREANQEHNDAIRIADKLQQAQAEAAALREALEKMWMASRNHTPEIDNVDVVFECQACKEAHDAARAALKGEAKRE